MEPYKIIVWGPGYLGSAIIRELVKRPEFSIVGVLCYSEEKAGVDIGSTIGIDPVGVKATRDKDEILAMDADCVLVCVKDAADYTELDNDVIRLLESGKDVICSTTYMYAPMRGKAYADRLLAACKKGGVSLHGTGENPAMMCERIALTLTGFCTEIEHIGVHEMANLDMLTNVDMLQAAGIGKDQAQAASPTGPVLDKWSPLFRDMIGFMGNALFDAPPERIKVEVVASCDIARDDIRVSDEFVIKKGTAACIRHEHRGSVDGRHFITMYLYWYYGPEYCPFPGITNPSHHVIEIEGKPVSLRVAVDGMTSLKSSQLTRDGDPTLPIYYMGAVALIQAIPVVCAAEPGFLFQTALTHYKDDFRKLAHRGPMLQ